MKDRRMNILRRQRLQGLGYLSHGRNVEMDVREVPRVLSRNVYNTDEVYGESYDVVIRVRVPAAVAKAPLPKIGKYLVDHGVVSSDFCQHAYDCCGRFYPSGSGKIIARRGRELLVEQSFNQNV